MRKSAFLLILCAGCTAPFSGRIARYDDQIQDLGSQLRQERFENRRLETVNRQLRRDLENPGWRDNLETEMPSDAGS